MEHEPILRLTVLLLRRPVRVRTLCVFCMSGEKPKDAASKTVLTNTATFAPSTSKAVPTTAEQQYGTRFRPVSWLRTGLPVANNHGVIM